MARLTAKKRDALKSDQFAGPGRSFPINDKAHIRAAKREEKFASPATRKKIDAAAKRAGVGTTKKRSK